VHIKKGLVLHCKFTVCLDFHIHIQRETCKYLPVCISLALNALWKQNKRIVCHLSYSCVYFYAFSMMLLQLNRLCMC